MIKYKKWTGAGPVMDTYDNMDNQSYKGDSPDLQEKSRQTEVQMAR